MTWASSLAQPPYSDSVSHVLPTLALGGTSCPVDQDFSVAVWDDSQIAYCHLDLDTFFLWYGVLLSDDFNGSQSCLSFSTHLLILREEADSQDSQKPPLKPASSMLTVRLSVSGPVCSSSDRWDAYLKRPADWLCTTKWTLRPLSLTKEGQRCRMASRVHGLRPSRIQGLSE